jgi:two-component system, chemotaxis family, protein-glutamate methylesterase/glutaminase
MASADRIIAIGGSLGAVEAVSTLLANLPPNLPAALAIAIHVGDQGNDLLAELFDEVSACPVRTAKDGVTVQPGHAYVAPADRHLLVIDRTLRLGMGPRENLARPAVDPLFRSIAFSYGPRAIAVVLTGLLNDGAGGLADVKRCGGVTIVQNPSDALAPDMPLEALRSGQVDYRAPLSQLPDLLVHLAACPPGPPLRPPDDIGLEVEIALGGAPGSGTIARLADPAPLSCPACGGVLSQMRQGPPLRFRCQVGHAYSAESLASAKEGSVDEAMRTAFRIIEERTVLTEKMAEEARRSGRPGAAASSDARAKEYREKANILKAALNDDISRRWNMT